MLFKIIKRFNTIAAVHRCMLCDVAGHFRHSLIFASGDRHKLIARIMLAAHSLEKGLAMPRKKENWGGQKAIQLIVLIERYIRKYPVEERVHSALVTLQSFRDDIFSEKNHGTAHAIDQLLSRCGVSCEKIEGAIRKIKKPRFSMTYEDIVSFYESRASVREFSDKPVTANEVRKVCRMVRTTPSACNRQPCRLYTFRDRGIIEKLINNQLGDQGWCMNCNLLFVVTANQSYYNATYERYQPFIDGGMFAMNLVMALHSQKIATCCKMFIQQPGLEKRFKKAAGIPACERPVMLVLAGHYPRRKVVLAPLSRRVELEVSIV